MSLALALGILVADVANVSRLTVANAQSESGPYIPVAEATVVGGKIAAVGVMVNGVATDGVFLGSITVVDSLIDDGAKVDNGVLTGDGSGDGVTGVLTGDSNSVTGVLTGDGLTGVLTGDSVTGVLTGDSLSGEEAGGRPATVTGGVVEGDNVTVVDGVITGENLRVVGAIVTGGAYIY